MHQNSDYHYCPCCGYLWDKPEATSTVGKHIVCTHCGFILYKDPKVAVCVIIDVDGKIVMIKRCLPTPHGNWAIPGGFVDAGETLEAAAIREVGEEILLDVEITGLVGAYSEEGESVVLIVYSGRIIKGRPGCGPEALEVRSFDYDSIPWDDLSFPINGKALRDYYARHDSGKRFD